MAGKKMMKKTNRGGSCECGCHEGFVKVTGWVLVILGLLGLLQAVNYINLDAYWFAYVWSIIVLIIGAKKIFWCNSCGCCK